MMHYVGTGITPAMTHAAVGVGSQYAYTAEDATRRLVGRRQGLHAHPARPHPGQDVLGHRHLRHPDPVPAADRQPLPEHPQPRRQPAQPRTTATPSSASGPPHRSGPDVNWLQTIPGKSWFPILRLYGPLEPWFDQTWRPRRNPTRLTRPRIATFPRVRQAHLHARAPAIKEAGLDGLTFHGLRHSAGRLHDRSECEPEGHPAPGWAQLDQDDVRRLWARTFQKSTRVLPPRLGARLSDPNAISRVPFVAREGEAGSTL